jgi:hypothetical protein
MYPAFLGMEEDSLTLFVLDGSLLHTLNLKGIINNLLPCKTIAR